jgi:hypothetical protein
MLLVVPWVNLIIAINCRQSEVRDENLPVLNSALVVSVATLITSVGVLPF